MLLLLFLKGRKLTVIGTTSCRDVLETMGIVEAFNTVIHVSSLSSIDHLKAVFQVRIMLLFSVKNWFMGLWDVLFWRIVVLFSLLMLVFSLQEVKLFDADEIKQIERNIGQQRCKNYRLVVVIYLLQASVAYQRNNFLQN